MNSNLKLTKSRIMNFVWKKSTKNKKKIKLIYQTSTFVMKSK
jgi:hypothetical protein